MTTDSEILATGLGHYPEQLGKIVEYPQSKSTQPRFARRWVSLYVTFKNRQPHLLHADPRKEPGELTVVGPDPFRGRPHSVGGQPLVERGQWRRVSQMIGVDRVVVGKPVQGGPTELYP